ncbi:hypothetical protein A9Q89_08815 [Gammaproteobacteria bacterium 53_120_T64]|nr:hypothetical protein A9Q89_08815 [Gammaproteobacteria bacterium 53_120_T64]
MALLHVNKIGLAIMATVNREKAMTQLRILFFVVLGMALFSTGRLHADADIKPILADARATLTTVAAKGFEWTTTRQLIAAAEVALAAGDKAHSLNLAKAALNEAEKSLLQANYAEAHWQDGMPF